MKATEHNTKLHTVRMTQVALMTAIISVVSPWVIVLPVSPVPVSLSLFVVLFAAYILGPCDGMICCGLYLLLGAVGLPVFSGCVGGPGKLLGPTGGYLVGYILAAGITGYAVSHFPGKRGIHFVGMILGVGMCYVLGTVWLCISMDVDMVQGLSMGVVPYIPADVVKIVAVFALGRELRKRIRKGL